MAGNIHLLSLSIFVLGVVLVSFCAKVNCVATIGYHHPLFFLPSTTLEFINTVHRLIQSLKYFVEDGIVIPGDAKHDPIKMVQIHFF